MPTALIITTAGINCDLELGHAFELAGAEVESIHLNRLAEEPALIERFDLIGLPGGFSYGDAVAAGRIAAQLIRRHLYGPLVQAVMRGVPMFAPCNGFQIAVQSGLLPGPAIGEGWPEEPPVPSVSLGDNEAGRFVDRWTAMEFTASRCVWTENLVAAEGSAILPNAHAEGRFVADQATIETLSANGQIAVRYAEDENFNGSADRIAGICDATGLVFGLMPHPERFTRWTQHPFWTRMEDDETTGDPIGLQMFRNAIAHAAQVATV